MYNDFHKKCNFSLIVKDLEQHIFYNINRICMKNVHRFIWIFVLVAICSVSCRKDEPPPTPPPHPPTPPINEVSLLVSQYLVYDGMEMFYLWDEQMRGRKPTATDTDAKRYFESLLYRPTDVWSWITDDVDALLRDFAGESARAFGFAPFVLWADQQRTRLVGLVRYIYPNTPAADEGMRRGDIIFEIDGRPITEANWRLLVDGGSTVTLTVYNQNFQNPRPVTITPRSFSANPVLHSSVHRFDNSDRVIGYLFYTAFRSNFNNYLYQAFRKFQREGVNELVLDLRYNPGGGVDAAVYLASLIAPREAVENNEVFTIMSYNRFINNLFDSNFERYFARGYGYENWERGWRLGVYDDSQFQNPLNANLNLGRVHIIATPSSASASELTIFCLRPFMDVYHIGGETSGKYTASWTVHAFDNFLVGEPPNRRARAQSVHNPNRFTAAQREELRNWAMQPIVGRYTDRDSRDFVAAGTLRPDFPREADRRRFMDEMFMFAPAQWRPIGSEDDFLFNEAIALITGRPRIAIPPMPTRASGKQFIDAHLRSPQEEQLRRAVNVDNVEIDPEMLRKMLESLR